MKITDAMLTLVCQRIAGVLNDDTYQLSHAYGGVQLVKIVTPSGGARDVLERGYMTKRECYEHMHSFLRGINVRNAE